MNQIDPSHITISGSTIYYNGVMYQKVEESQSFYDKLWELISTKVGNNTDADELTDRIMDLIESYIPTPTDEEIRDAALARWGRSSLN